MVLINNRVMDANGIQDLHFFKSTEGPFSRDAGYKLTSFLKQKRYLNEPFLALMRILLNNKCFWIQKSCFKKI